VQVRDCAPLGASYGGISYRFPQLKAEGVTSGAGHWVWTDSVI
jgi:hypothetical protein